MHASNADVLLSSTALQAREAVRLERLRALLCYVVDWVTYYRDRSTHYDPDLLRSTADLSRLPLLTRQDLPLIPNSGPGVLRGGYTVVEVEAPDLIFVGTGSELHLCTLAAEQLAKEGLRAKVVSMPSIERFMAERNAPSTQ